MKNQNKTTRLLHITDALPDYHSVWGGAEKVAFRQIKMSAKLAKMKIFVASTRPINPIQENFQFFTILTTEDFLLKKVARFVSAFKNQIFPFDLITFFSLVFVILKVRPDIVHLHKTTKISLTPVVVAKIFRIPIILAIYDYWYFCPARLLVDKQANPCYKFHGPWCKKCSAIEQRSLLKIISFFRRWIFNIFLSRVNRFSVLSKSCRELISKYPLSKEKIFVVRQLSINPQIKNKLPIEKNLIFFNTWMLPHKGVHIVIKALAEVIKQISQAKLCMAIKDINHYSNPSYYKKIKKLISDLKVEENVVFIGRPKHQEYLEYLQRANVVVVAEQWENMAPTTLADAMSFGKPIVASRIGGIPEMIKEGGNGLLANPKKPKDFAEKIIKILSDSSFAERLGQQAARDIQELGSEKIIQNQLNNLYQF